MWPPTAARLGSNLQRPELVERDRRSIGGSMVHVPPDQLFFERTFRSLQSFQVLVRCSRTLLARRICRIMSMLIDATMHSATMSPRSLPSDQRRKGRCHRRHSPAPRRSSERRNCRPLHTGRGCEVFAIAFCQELNRPEWNQEPPAFSHVIIRLPQWRHSRRRMMRSPQVGRV